MGNPARFGPVALKKLRNLIRNVRRDGWRETAGLYAYRIHEKYRDMRLGIRTMGFHDRNDLGLGADCADYQAIHYRCLDIVFTHLRPSGRDVFLDYGCGKGRAVVTAAIYPFRRVIGVELSAELSEIARDNVRRAARKLTCGDVDIVTGNAATYEVPPDVTVIFLFNPFTGSVLSTVQQRIRESLQQTHRRLRIVYVHPAKAPNAFEECKWLTKLCELPTADWDEVKLLVYESRLVSGHRPDSVFAVASID